MKFSLLLQVQVEVINKCIISFIINATDMMGEIKEESGRASPKIRLLKLIKHMFSFKVKMEVLI